MMHQFGAMPLWMMLGMAVFWVALVALVVLLVLLTMQLIRSNRLRRETPLDIARRRLASGELTRDEFETIHQTLSQPSVASGNVAPR